MPLFHIPLSPTLIIYLSKQSEQDAHLEVLPNGGIFLHHCPLGMSQKWGCIDATVHFGVIPACCVDPSVNQGYSLWPTEARGAG